MHSFKTWPGQMMSVVLMRCVVGWGGVRGAEIGGSGHFVTRNLRHRRPDKLPLVDPAIRTTRAEETYSKRVPSSCSCSSVCDRKYGWKGVAPLYLNFTNKGSECWMVIDRCDWDVIFVSLTYLTAELRLLSLISAQPHLGCYYYT